MSYTSYPQRSTWLEFLGFPPGYGPWTYRAIPEPLISSELARLASAHVNNSKTTMTGCVSLQPSPDPDDRSQDRFVVLDWDGWSFSAVFDGHGGEEAVDYVVQELPSLIHAALTKALANAGTAPLAPSAVSTILQSSIQAVDDTLTNGVKHLFPDEATLAALTDEQIKSIINGPTNPNNLTILRCMRGTTALISLVDPKKENLWVASLGDCQAVLGTKNSNGKWDATILSVNHSGRNPAEVARIRKEHPNESECIKFDRILGAIAVTRGDRIKHKHIYSHNHLAIGDHIFKLPVSYTTRVFMNCVPGFSVSSKLEHFLPHNKSPPYLSALADIKHVALQPSTTNTSESFLILCSDGLIDLYEHTNSTLEEILTQWVHMLGERMDRRGAKVGGEADKENTALVLLRHALMGGGVDNPDRLAQMLTVEIPCRWMDDTTALVQTLDYARGAHL
ncbi:protein serine threonine phosphatase 2C [Suillus subalutaceus]|uniref:protein serine threonine phosphatase 2C n=1 Tax=Suillus subalutaceus TaxID=48586 RepID=UPI001B87B4E3|nr:protein serine threonine phosphatase 2C [Suillus subalutaceus]KAG1861589.1 protein serine threonine phosphatase 2C [Suillus subalutaceus]